MDQIIFGVIAGVIAAGLIEVGRLVFAYYVRGKFKDVFGADLFSSDGLHLVYAQLSLRPLRDEHGDISNYPYEKPGNERSGVFFSIDRPVSSCELRAAKYLSAIMGKEANNTPLLSSDFELRDRLNISFVSFGGPDSNLKSRDVITNDANDLLTLTDQGFTSVLSNRVVQRPQSEFDYGLILKIHPTQFPERTWLICAGFGEWGSSGAAWYLAFKWRKIQKYAKNNPFAIVVRVRPEQDEFAEPVIRVQSPSDAERYANRIT